MLLTIIFRLVDFYTWLILAYCIMTWFPMREGGLASDVFKVLASICEPYLGLFKRIIPSFGGVDFSPVIAIVALQVVERLLVRIL